MSQPMANQANKRACLILRQHPYIVSSELERLFALRTPPHELTAISAAAAKRERKQNKRNARGHS